MGPDLQAQPVLAPILENLSADQVAAVTHGEGPLLIVAGAGTGKTTAITRRIAYLVAAKRARPSEILALTFTDKAAEEMEERVDLLVPYGFADIWISTFHAFGDRLLREEGLALGLNTDFRVLSRSEQLVFMREHLFDLPLQRLRPLGDPTRHLQALAGLFSRAKDEAASPADYLAAAEALAQRAAAAPSEAALAEEAGLQGELAACYAAYQRLLAARGLVDFGDQVLLCLRLLREHPAVLEKYRQRFRYVLVDEFQDTNHTQWELVKLLVGAVRNLTVVGDDDQSIYKFRGAAISNILQFTATYPGAARVILRENFRSGQAILDAAYRLIRQNDPDRLEVRERIDKRLVAQVEGEPPRHLHYDTRSSEADGVARLIADRVRAGAWTWQDVAILVRGNRDADPFLRALNLQGIPWRFSGNQGLYARPEIRLLIAFLRVVADPDDSLNLYLLAGSELYRMDDWHLAQCLGIAKRSNRPLRWVLERIEELPQLADLDPEARATAAGVLADLKRYVAMARERSTGELLYQFLMRSGLLKRLTESGSPTADVKVGNIARFFELVHRFGEVAETDRVGPFVRHLDLLIASGDDPAAVEAEVDADAVQVLTVHKAKGLEFPAVFLVSLVADRFPSRTRREPLGLPESLLHDAGPTGDFHLQEERRLFYVGMTRAKRELYLTSARDYGGARAKKVSRFVLEALDLPAAELSPYRASAAEAIARHAPPVEESPGEFRIIPDDEILPLSYYQVDDYLTCPLKYKYVHVLRVPIREHHSVIYGKALHEAISFYLRRRLAGQAVDEAEVLEAFERAWEPVGFLSREHEELRLEAGRAVLRRFVAEEGARTSGPSAVEQPFAFFLGTNKIVGRWDRLDEAEGRVSISDYKSSTVRDQKEADKKARESLQLTVYALAYQRTHGRVPDAVHLHFLESGLVGTAVKDAGDLVEAQASIEAVAQGIRGRRFAATPGFLQCSYCAFREICPSTAYREAE